MKIRTAMASLLLLGSSFCNVVPALGATSYQEWDNYGVDFEDSFFETAQPLTHYINLTREDEDTVIPEFKTDIFSDAKSLVELTEVKEDFRDVGSTQGIPVKWEPSQLAPTNLESPSLALATPKALPLPKPSTERILLADANPLSSVEMNELRGGFIDPTGLIINFAVNVQTDLNGAQIFTKSFTITPSGPNGALQGVGNTNLISKNAPGNLNVGLIGNGTGILITNPNGQMTTVLNQTAAGTPSSIVMNTANNTNIAQSVAVSLALKNLSSVSNYVHTVTQSALAQRTALRSLGF